MNINKQELYRVGKNVVFNALEGISVGLAFLGGIHVGASRASQRLMFGVDPIVDMYTKQSDKQTTQTKTAVVPTAGVASDVKVAFDPLPIFSPFTPSDHKHVLYSPEQEQRDKNK